MDDDVSVCSCIAECLRLEGFEVAEAFDGAGALAKAVEQGQSIFAVLSDVNMPGMDGFEMWSRMKPLVAPDCKIVFMSGLAHWYFAQGAEIPGDLIQKPFLFSALLEKLSYIPRNPSSRPVTATC